MQFGEQPVPLVGEEEGDLERKRLALRGASHKCSGSSSCVQHRALCVFGKGLCIQPGGRWSRTFQRVCTFPCCFTVAQKTKFKNRDRRRETGEKHLPGWAEGTLLTVSGPQWSTQGMARCETHHSGYRTETSILADKSKAFWGIPWLFSSWDSALSRKGGLDLISG